MQFYLYDKRMPKLAGSAIFFVLETTQLRQFVSRFGIEVRENCALWEQVEEMDNGFEDKEHG